MLKWYVRVTCVTVSVLIAIALPDELIGLKIMAFFAMGGLLCLHELSL
jgi:hypothetical protein